MVGGRDVRRHVNIRLARNLENVAFNRIGLFEYYFGRRIIFELHEPDMSIDHLFLTFTYHNKQIFNKHKFCTSFNH